MKKMQKKILVLRYRFIGDTILAVPFLRNLRRAEPDAHIAWLVAPGSTDVVAGIPYVDEFIYWDPLTTYADSRGMHRTLAGKRSFIEDLRLRRFGKAYVLKRSFSSALIAFLSGASERIGFATEGRSLLLTRRMPYRHDQHEVQNFLDVLRADNIPVIDDYLEAWLTPDEERFSADFLTAARVAPGERIIAIHPFAANQIRAWHEDGFVAVANRIQEVYGCRILLLGGERDVELGRYLQERIFPAPLMAIGTTTLRQTMALLARCCLLICNDSGIMHLGAALDVPLVALFGPQSPVKFGPWSRRCRVIYSDFPCSPCKQKFFTECRSSDRGKPECLETISVAQVLDKVKELLDAGVE